MWFGTDRYVSVCHPFQQERFCSRRRPVATIGTLAAIALAINAVQAYFWTYNYDNGDCGLRPEVNAVFSPGKFFLGGNFSPPPANLQSPRRNACQIVCPRSLFSAATNSYKHITKTFFRWTINAVKKAIKRMQIYA